jgi:hypothetical protein
VNEAYLALNVEVNAGDSDDECSSDEEGTEHASGSEWSTSGSEWSSDAESGSSCDDDEDPIGRYYDYGDLNESGGSYKVQLVDGTEISLEEHERFCDCGLGENDSENWCLDEDSCEDSNCIRQR